MTANVRSALRTLARPLERLVPERCRLPYEVTRLRLAKRLEEEIPFLPVLTERRELALDIGANRGYYTYHLARLFARVEAFEPNPSVLSPLLAWGRRNVGVHNVALSASEGVMELFVPVVQGVRQHGWASFDQNNLPEAPEVEVLQVPVRPLDSFGFRRVSFIKMDVEGHEPAVLLGAARTIETSRPVVLIEVKERNRDAVFAFFERLGYAPFQIWRRELHPYAELAGVAEASGENYIFRPDEKLLSGHRHD